MRGPRGGRHTPVTTSRSSVTRADIGAGGCAVGRCRWLGTSLRPAPIRRCGRGVQHARPRCVPRHGRAARATWVQYLHENQLTYPRQPGESLDTGLADAVAESGRRRRDLVQQRLPTRRAHRRPRPAARLAPDHGHEPERAALEAKLRIEHPGVDIRGGDLDRRARHVRSWCRTSGGTTTRMWVRSSERSGDSSSAGRS